MIDWLDVITSIALVIGSFYFFTRRLINKPSTAIAADDDDDDEEEDDDLLFHKNIDKRSSRPSYTRFMRRNFQQEDRHKNPFLCVICWNEKKTILLLPCKHLCLCVSCSQTLGKNTVKRTCPICRKEVENLLEVFL